MITGASTFILRGNNLHQGLLLAPSGTMLFLEPLRHYNLPPLCLAYTVLSLFFFVCVTSLNNSSCSFFSTVFISIIFFLYLFLQFFFRNLIYSETLRILPLDDSERYVPSSALSLPL